MRSIHRRVGQHGLHTRIERFDCIEICGQRTRSGVVKVSQCTNQNQIASDGGLACHRRELSKRRGQGLACRNRGRQRHGGDRITVVYRSGVDIGSNVLQAQGGYICRTAFATSDVHRTVTRDLVVIGCELGCVNFDRLASGNDDLPCAIEAGQRQRACKDHIIIGINRFGAVVIETAEPCTTKILQAIDDDVAVGSTNLIDVKVVGLLSGDRQRLTIQNGLVNHGLFKGQGPDISGFIQLQRCCRSNGGGPIS